MASPEWQQSNRIGQDGRADGQVHGCMAGRHEGGRADGRAGGQAGDRADWQTARRLRGQAGGCDCGSDFASPTVHSIIITRPRLAWGVDSSFPTPCLGGGG